MTCCAKEKKVVGILTEIQADPDIVHAAIIGVGMNVNQKSEDFPAEIKDLATSLAAIKGQSLRRAPIVAAFF